MKRAGAFILSICCLLCCLSACTMAAAHTTPQTEAPPTEPTVHIPETTEPAPTDPPLRYGWLEEDGVRRFRSIFGNYWVGWLEDGVNRYYFNEDGVLQTGWLELDGEQYYLHPDGTAARGKIEIDGRTYYFASNGTLIHLVNPWNTVPEDYVPDLVPLSTAISDEGSYIDRSCYDWLVEMVADCNQYSGARVHIISAYRSNTDQYYNYQRKINYFREQGYSTEAAKVEAAYFVAVPGTSEHELGLAVDIIDTRLWTLSQKQENYAGQKWLMENSWRYGFILRYPKDKIDVTGIIYEPWHYRYVGVEVATELFESGLTLEEYMENIS